jgi:hypothetical protein
MKRLRSWAAVGGLLLVLGGVTHCGSTSDESAGETCGTRSSGTPCAVCMHERCCGEVAACVANAPCADAFECVAILAESICDTARTRTDWIECRAKACIPNDDAALRQYIDNVTCRYDKCLDACHSGVQFVPPSDAGPSDATAE